MHFDDTLLMDEVVVATLPVPSDTPAQTWGPIATVLRQTEQLSEVDVVGADEIDNYKKDTIGPFREPDKPTDILSEEEFIADFCLFIAGFFPYFILRCGRQTSPHNIIDLLFICSLILKSLTASVIGCLSE